MESACCSSCDRSPCAHGSTSRPSVLLLHSCARRPCVTSYGEFSPRVFAAKEHFVCSPASAFPLVRCVHPFHLLIHSTHVFTPPSFQQVECSRRSPPPGQWAPRWHPVDAGGVSDTRSSWSRAGTLGQDGGSPVHIASRVPHLHAPRPHRTDCPHWLPHPYPRPHRGGGRPWLLGALRTPSAPPKPPGVSVPCHSRWRGRVTHCPPRGHALCPW